jgi:hypothetical protein
LASLLPLQFSLMSKHTLSRTTPMGADHRGPRVVSREKSGPLDRYETNVERIKSI